MRRSQLAVLHKFADEVMRQPIDIMELSQFIATVCLGVRAVKISRNLFALGVRSQFLDAPTMEVG
jgi:hypothetical protein